MACSWILINEGEFVRHEQDLRKFLPGLQRSGFVPRTAELLPGGPGVNGRGVGVGFDDRGPGETIEAKVAIRVDDEVDDIPLLHLDGWYVEFLLGVIYGPETEFPMAAGDDASTDTVAAGICVRQGAGDGGRGIVGGRSSGG